MKTIILISVLGIASLFGGIFNIKNTILLIFILIGLILGIFFNINDWNTSIQYFNEMIWYDNYTIVFSSTILIASIFIFSTCFSYYKKEFQHTSDIYGLVLFMLVGGIVMIAACNFVMFFIGLEILSISLYILTGSNRKNKLSNEASLKYFLTGSMASGILLFGIALVYGATTSFNFQQISQKASTFTAASPMLSIGYLLITIGFLFKISAVPFHTWTPDVYEGSPTIITMFMSTVVKTAAVGSLLRFLWLAKLSDALSFSHEWEIIFSIIATATLLIGNITALYQTNLKRLLAYSSISHIGYLLLGIGFMNNNPQFFNWIVYYLIAYSLATIAVFTIILVIKDNKNKVSIELEDLSGLGKTNPVLSFILSLSLFSLAGIPPLAGFMAKYYMFTIALEKNYLWLVIIAVITSTVGLYYYIRLINRMYREDGSTTTTQLKIDRPYYIVLVIISILLIIIGLFPQLITHFL